MNNKHTPGPWKVTYNGSYGPYVDAPGNDRTGYGTAAHDIGIETHSICAVGGPNAKANARLIAAAPELLAALKLCAEIIRDAGDELPTMVAGGYDQVNEAADAVNAALARAEGK